MGPMNNYSKAGSAMRRVVLSAVVASGAVVAYGTVSAQTSMPGHAGMTDSKVKNDGKAPMKMHAAMEEMNKKMSAMKMTGKADIDYAMMMVAHHQAAIDMAKAELESGKDPAMMKMAKKVIAAQTKEIAQLEAWLKKNPHAM